MAETPGDYYDDDDDDEERRESIKLEPKAAKELRALGKTISREPTHQSSAGRAEQQVSGAQTARARFDYAITRAQLALASNRVEPQQSGPITRLARQIVTQLPLWPRKNKPSWQQARRKAARPSIGWPLYGANLRCAGQLNLRLDGKIGRN